MCIPHAMVIKMAVSYVYGEVSCLINIGKKVLDCTYVVA